MSPTGIMGVESVLLTYARAFTFAAVNIEYNRGQVNMLQIFSATELVRNDSPLGQGTLSSLNIMRDLCAQIPSLNGVVHPIDRLIGKINFGVLPVVLHNELENLQHRVMDELRNHYYFPVTPVNAQLFDNEKPFGDGVYEAFPSAREDIIEAARCLVFERSTASAFHVMRALEAGLKQLAVKLAITYSPSWDAYFRAIEKKLARPHGDKTRSQKKSEPMYRDILGDMTAVKTAWRNPTMHIERQYSSHEAVQIFIAASTLLEKMVQAGLKERSSGRRLADNEIAPELPAREVSLNQQL